MPLTLYRLYNTFAWQTFASLRLFTCLVYLSTYYMPIAHLRQNKPFQLLYLGHAQIKSKNKVKKYDSKRGHQAHREQEHQHERKKETEKERGKDKTRKKRKGKKERRKERRTRTRKDENTKLGNK